MSEALEIGKRPRQPGYEWLDEKLDRELNAIVEELESGGKISAADFSRLVEFHREIAGPDEETPRAEWREAA